MPTPLLLCPGLLNDAELWRHQTTTLVDVAQPVVADLTRGDSMAAIAEAVLADAPDRFALAALSMGGYLAFEILRQAPERVSRLALFNTKAGPDDAQSRQRRLDMIDITRRGGFARLPPQMLQAQVHPDHAADPKISGSVFQMAARIGAAAFIRQQQAILGRPDSRPDLAGVAVPTLVVSARQDQLTPPAVMAEIAGAVPGARMVVIEEAGHLTPLEQPQAVSALLRLWLQL